MHRSALPKYMPAGTGYPTIGHHPPVIYFLLQQHTVVYVGQSIQLKGRVQDHRCGKEFDTVRYWWVPNLHQCKTAYDAQSTVNEVEAEYIKKYEPKYNTWIPGQQKPYMTEEKYKALRKVYDELYPESDLLDEEFYNWLFAMDAQVEHRSGNQQETQSS